MEGGLPGAITMRGPDRATAPREAAPRSTIAAGWRRYVCHANRAIEPCRCDGLDRAAGQAGLPGAVLARVQPALRRRYVEGLGERERAAIRMPQAEFRMNQNAEW